MVVYFTNENTMRTMTEAEKDTLIENIREAVKDFDGSGLDLENFRYTAQVRFRGMTFFCEVSGEDNFLFDGEDSFTGFSEDTEITVRRIA